MTPALSVSHVSVSFGGVIALADVSLLLPAGERHVIIGTNGAGKTTLFNVVNGQIRPNRGQVRLGGRDITRMPIRRRAAAGLSRTFQITSLFPTLTVLENTLLAVQAHTHVRWVFHRPAATDQPTLDRVRALLENWHLWDRAGHLAGELSYGVQRRLEIVLALAGTPRLLLLDEPMAGLSIAEIHQAVEMILALDRSITVLMIEHDLAAAFRVADCVTAMDRGRIVASGTPESIRSKTILQQIYTLGKVAAT